MFKPVNRYILVEEQAKEENQTNSGIVLPDSFKPTEERHAAVVVLDWADDVRFKDMLFANSKIIIDKSMLEEINIDGGQYNVILDNYIIGIL